ncbi:MAG: hypothetical protein ABI896_01540 [Actinomycetota bacterium]
MPGDEQRRTRLRSFVLGGLLGASAAVLATVRRRRGAAERAAAPAGLAAFEDAPCFRETVEREEHDT